MTLTGVNSSEAVTRRCSVVGALENFAKFTGKYLCQSLFFNNFIKKETLAQMFSCEFCEIFKNTFFKRTPLVAAFNSFILNKKWDGIFV